MVVHNIVIQGDDRYTVTTINDHYANPREPPVRWNVIADLLKVLPPLKPTSDGVATFIFALDRVTEYSVLTWVELTFVLTNRAQLGAVSASLLAELTSLDDYAQARAWLLGLFGASQTADHLDLEMESIRQRQGESVLDYFSRFRDLVLRLQTALGGPGQLPNTQLVRRFVKGRVQSSMPSDLYREVAAQVLLQRDDK